MVFRSLLCIHAIISIFISHSLFLTKLQGKDSQEKVQSTRALMFAFSPPKHLLLGVAGDRMLFCMDF